MTEGVLVGVVMLDSSTTFDVIDQCFLLVISNTMLSVPQLCLGWRVWTCQSKKLIFFFFNGGFSDSTELWCAARDWIGRNKLVLNTDKMKCMVFGYRHIFDRDNQLSLSLARKLV